MDRRRLRRRGGFTLLEMMLVVVIIGLLATVVVVNFGGQSRKAQRNLCVTTLSQIKSALTQYQIENGTYPPDLTAIAGPGKALEKLPKDPWKNDFIYVFPGAAAAANPDQAYDLLSPGPDKRTGNEDDINVWTMDKP